MNPYHRLAHQAHYNVMSRPLLVREYSWAIPDEWSIQTIVSVKKPLVEMGAGNGYWASLITAAGGSVECYDREPGSHCDGSTGHLWHPVMKGESNVLGSRHRDYALLLVWPPYDTPMAKECLLEFMKVGGDTFIYVGEGEYGCTGDNEFHRVLQDHWSMERFADIPNWDGLKDSLYVYRRV